MQCSLANNKTFIKVNTMLFQKGDQLFLEGYLSMVFFLGLDVLLNGRDVRLADAEGRVANLPTDRC